MTMNDEMLETIEDERGSRAAACSSRAASPPPA